MNPIGIMQGRLSPPVSFRLQAFPWSSWQDEFDRARQCQIDLIEWLFEADDFVKNPIWSDDGTQEIQDRILSTGIQVQTCCADYFMPHPFFRVSEEKRRASIQVLIQLIHQAARIGVNTILVPVLEVCEIRTSGEKTLLLESLSQPLRAAEEAGITLGLETELPADEYLALVKDGGSKSLGVYYDTGNNAAQGHDIVADIRVLLPYLAGIHVKDRKRGGSSVLLGEGDANFDGFFRVISQSGYSHPIIMQTAFGPDYLGIASRHLKYIKDRLAVTHEAGA